MVMTTPKPGDRLTAEQLLTLPNGSVVDIRRTVPFTVECPSMEYRLVSLPTPPDMAPGSVVLDEDGVAWLRLEFGEWYSLGNNYRRWPTLALRVRFPEGVLHDAAVTT